MRVPAKSHLPSNSASPHLDRANLDSSSIRNSSGNNSGLFYMCGRVGVQHSKTYPPVLGGRPAPPWCLNSRTFSRVFWSDRGRRWTSTPPGNIPPPPPRHAGDRVSSKREGFVLPDRLWVVWHIRDISLITGLWTTHAQHCHNE
ncbi:hypothetical protein CHARACLAT_005116 [Characodon lateralis]|uniref:Uncharacterized protein n=1 Tax=Characodon lateralis TaxID=208331 RepID=A0ABU7CPR2_9TELE|nr:hypothetical protein [Characodon lateralis]